MTELPTTTAHDWYTKDCLCHVLGDDKMMERCLKIGRCRLRPKSHDNQRFAKKTKEEMVGALLDYIRNGKSLIEVRTIWGINYAYIYKKLALAGISARSRTEAARRRWDKARDNEPTQAPYRKLIPYKGKEKGNGDSW